MQFIHSLLLSTSPNILNVHPGESFIKSTMKSPVRGLALGREEDGNVSARVTLRVNATLDAQFTDGLFS
jgi:hypothetical protein